MKVELQFVESTSNYSDVIITTPEGMTEDELHDIVMKVSSECKYGSSEDVAQILQERYEILVHKVVPYDFDSELEYRDLELLEE